MPETTENSELTELGRKVIETYEAGQVILSLHLEFEKFSPLDTPVTDFPHSAYARQAREILSARNREEVRYAVMIAEWAVQSRLAGQIQTPSSRSVRDWIDKVGMIDETLPRILQRRRTLFDIRQLEDLHKAKWQEIYAALTLAYVARAINKGLTTSAEAAEAIQIALSFVERSKSAKHKDAEWRELAICYSVGKEDMSAKKIADGYLEYYKDKIKQNRKNMLRPRTVADWIRKARRFAPLAP